MTAILIFSVALPDCRAVRSHAEKIFDFACNRIIPEENVSWN